MIEIPTRQNGAPDVTGCTAAEASERQLLAEGSSRTAFENAKQFLP